MDFRYKHSRVKQYLKGGREGEREGGREGGKEGGRAYRIETVINKTSDLGLRPGLSSARADRQGPASQPSSAYDRTCQPGMCHRHCAV